MLATPISDILFTLNAHHIPDLPMTLSCHSALFPDMDAFSPLPVSDLYLDLDVVDGDIPDWSFVQLEDSLLTATTSEFCFKSRWSPRL
jgi:hypothetical protein